MIDTATLHALELEPRAARPGETVTVRFQARNHAPFPTAAATVRFILDEALEPLADLAVGLLPAAPGEVLRASLPVRVPRGLADGSRFEVRAALELPDRQIATNVRALTVRSCAVLDGAASGVIVELLDHAHVRVRAVVVNDGDGPASSLTLVVPPPDGTQPLEHGATSMSIARIEPGEAARFAYDARIVAVVDALRVDDAFVSAADGKRWCIPARNEVVPSSAVDATAEISLERTRAGITIEVTNDGWADAHDVSVRIAPPPQTRLVDGSLVVDGIPVAFRSRRKAVESCIARACVERGTLALGLTIARVPAQATVRCNVALFVPPNAAAGAADIRVGDRCFALPLVPQPYRELRARIVRAPGSLEPNAPATVVIEVVNAGDVAETVTFDASVDDVSCGDIPAAVSLGPGLLAYVAFSVVAPSTCADGATVSAAIAVVDDRGARLTVERSIAVRNRVALVLDDTDVDGERVVYHIRNAGSTAAHDAVAVVGPTILSIGSISPGATRSLAFDRDVARSGGAISIGARELLLLPPPHDDPNAGAHATIEVPERVEAGAAFPVDVTIEAHDDIDTLTVRAKEPVGMRYAGGSTTVDRRSVLDRGGVSPLSGEGLCLRGVSRGTRVHLTWSLVADAADDDGRHVECTFVADGRQYDLSSDVVVRQQDPFPLQAPGAPYYLDAFAFALDAAPVTELVADPACDVAQVEHDAFVFTARFDAVRREEIERLLHDPGARGLAPHILALRAFFPDASTSNDATLTGLLDTLRTALRDVADRLFVKLRIPSFDVATSDLEDRELRTALVVLLERLEIARAEPTATDRLWTRLERTQAISLLAGLLDAPLGAPAALRALAAFVPTRCDDEPHVAAALARYITALDDALARFVGEPLELFDVALAYGSDPALQDARAEVLRALRMHDLTAVLAR